MIIAKSEVIIDRPVEEVYSYMADMLKSPEWCPVMLSIRQTVGDGVVAGAEYISTEKPLFFSLKNHYRLLRLDSPEKVEWSFSTFLLAGKGTYQLEPGGGKTVVRQVNEFRLRGVFKVFAPVFRKTGDRFLGDQFRRLKAIQESHVAAAPVPDRIGDSLASGIQHRHNPYSVM